MRFTSWFSAPLFALSALACASSGPAHADTAKTPQEVPPAPTPRPATDSNSTAAVPASPPQPEPATASEADQGATAPSPFGSLPWLGVSMDSGGDLGVRVEGVVRGSPAERSGVRLGD